MHLTNKFLTAFSTSLLVVISKVQIPIYTNISRYMCSFWINGVAIPISLPSFQSGLILFLKNLLRMF